MTTTQVMGWVIVGMFFAGAAGWSEAVVLKRDGLTGAFVGIMWYMGFVLFTTAVCMILS